LIAAALLIGLALGWLAADRGWSVPGLTDRLASPPPGSVVVRPGQSIMAAMAGALPGTTIVVEPGEYRERVTLRDGVRVVSRVPHSAVIRLPNNAAESDAAVMASGVANAELNGFRIVGGAGSPLGVGVITRDASVRLVDLDISGALTAAVDLGAGDEVGLSGSVIHDNPGSAMVIRAGAAPRVAHSVFTRNSTSDRLSEPVVVEAGAAPHWSQNVFNGMAPESVGGLDAAARAALPRHNWFIAAPAAAVPAVRHGGPGR
jgi:hypothetical protein